MSLHTPSHTDLNPPAFFALAGTDKEGFIKRHEELDKQAEEREEARFVSSEEIDEFYGNPFDIYSVKYDEFKEAGNETAIVSLNEEYDLLKERRERATVKTGDLTFDDMTANVELMKSLRRRYGHKDLDGTPVTEQSLLEKWASEQHFFDFNTGKLVIDAATIKELDTQQQQDFLLQLELWERVKGTGEGSQPLFDQALEIGKGLVTDPLTYVGISTLGAAFLGKEAVKKGTKEGVKNLLRDVLKNKLAKGAIIGVAEGGSIGAIHETSRQIVISKVQGLDAMENMDWSRVVKVAGISALLGAGLGGMFGAGAHVLGKFIDNYVARTGIKYSEVIRVISKIESEADALKFMVAELGIKQKTARELVNTFHDSGARFDSSRDKWQTIDGKQYNPADVITAKELEGVITKPILRQEKSVVKTQTQLARARIALTKLKTVNAKKKKEKEIKQLERALKGKETRLDNLRLKQKETNALLLESSTTGVPSSAEQRRRLLEGTGFSEEGLDAIIARDLELSSLDAVQQSVVRENVSSKIGLTINEWMLNTPLLRHIALGGEVVATKVGAKHIVERFRAVFANHQMNLANLKKQLEDAIHFTGRTDDELLALLRNPKFRKMTTEERKFVGLWAAIRKQQLDLAVKNKVITRKVANKFLANTEYVPRVYNFRLLQSKTGSGEFAKLLNKIDAKAVEDIISNITGGNYNKDYIPKSGSFTGKDVRNILKGNRSSVKDSRAVLSNHLEKSRRIHGIPEEELDKFMVSVDARMSSFLDDLIMRNELASKFGAKNEVVLNTLTSLGKTKNKTTVDAVKEYYFTAIGDSANSRALQAMASSTGFTKFVSQLNAFQNLKLVLAAIPNATQAFVYGAIRLSSTTNPLNATYLAGKNIVLSFRKEEREFARRAGVLNEMDMQRLMLENNSGGRIFNWEGEGFLKPLNWLNDNTKFLRAVGFHGVEEMNRRAGATMGALKVQMIHNKLKGTLTQKKRTKLESEMRDLGVGNPNKKELTDDDLYNAGYFFNKDINFSGEHINLPAGWHSPLGKLLSKFRSFQFYSGRFMKRHVLDELFIHKNPAPAVALLIAGTPAGMAVKSLRQELSQLFLEEEFLKENKGVIREALEGLAYVGAWGVWTDMLGQAGTSFGQRQLLGPGLSLVMNTGEALIGKIATGDFYSGFKQLFNATVPGIPGKKALMDELFPDKRKKKRRKSGSLF